jgi:hypothetical protein
VAAPPPEPAGVLTSQFPSAREMIGWAWGHAAGWAGDNLLLTLAGVVVAVAWFLWTAVRQVVQSV